MRIRVRWSLGKRGFHEKAWSCQPEPGFFLPGNQPLTDAEHVRNAVPRFDQVIDVSDEDRGGVVARSGHLPAEEKKSATRRAVT